MYPQPIKSGFNLTLTAATGIGLSLGVAIVLNSNISFASDSATGTKDIQVETKTEPVPNPGNNTPVPNNPPPVPNNPPAPNTTKPTDSTQSTNTGRRFTCEVQNGQYTVMYYPQNQNGQGYAWATPTGMGDGWSPERRCNEISNRLETYRPDGLLEMQIAKYNIYNIVCITTQKNPTCRIVLTVPLDQDPKMVRDRIFNNLTVADSGQKTDAVNTFLPGDNEGKIIQDTLGINIPGLGGRSNSVSSPDRINLLPFLAPTDGGTGTKLRSGIPMDTPHRLNPNNFR